MIKNSLPGLTMEFFSYLHIFKANGETPNGYKSRILSGGATDKEVWICHLPRRGAVAQYAKWGKGSGMWRAVSGA